MDNDEYTLHKNRFDYDRIEFSYDLDQEWPDNSDFSDIFIGLTKALQKFYDINKGVLIINEPEGTRFIATATWNKGNTRKNLSIKLPHVFSLFKNIAEDGQLYTDNFCQLFDGNSFERNLLLDSDTKSFAVQPLKFEAEVVGLIGYSSKRTMAFTTFENGILEKVARQFARRIGKTIIRN